MGKTTNDNYRKLKEAKKYDDAQLSDMVDREFSLTLDTLMREKNVTTADLEKNCTFSKSYINRIRSPKRKEDRPRRNTIIDIALGMNATLEETNLLLHRARYQELYTRDKAESIIIWGMLKNMSGAEIRELLNEKGYLDKMFPEKQEKTKK